MLLLLFFQFSILVFVVLSLLLFSVVVVSSLAFIAAVFIHYPHKFLTIQPVYPVFLVGLTSCKRAKPVWRRDDRNTVASDQECQNQIRQQHVIQWIQWFLSTSCLHPRNFQIHYVSSFLLTWWKCIVNLFQMALFHALYSYSTNKSSISMLSLSLCVTWASPVRMVLIVGELQGSMYQLCSDLRAWTPLLLLGLKINSDLKISRVNGIPISW